MKTRTGSLFAWLTVTIVLISAPAAWAQNYFQQTAPDGAILITQDTVLGFALPGDAQGFPITITQPGSYRLASNIVVPDANTTAIVITANHVTLDLGGFAILGPTVCAGTPVTNCSPTGNGVGVSVPAFSTVNTTVRNGTVSGMGRTGINLSGQGARVEAVTVTSNGTNGIQASNAILQNNHAIRNGANGIVTGNTNSIFLGNSATGNNALGLSGGPRDAAAHNLTNDNGVNGLIGNQTAGNVCNGVLCP